MTGRSGCRLVVAMVDKTDRNQGRLREWDVEAKSGDQLPRSSTLLRWRNCWCPWRRSC